MSSRNRTPLPGNVHLKYHVIQSLKTESLDVEKFIRALLLLLLLLLFVFLNWLHCLLFTVFTAHSPVHKYRGVNYSCEEFRRKSQSQAPMELLRLSSTADIEAAVRSLFRVSLQWFSRYQ